MGLFFLAWRHCLNVMVLCKNEQQHLSFWMGFSNMRFQVLLQPQC